MDKSAKLILSVAPRVPTTRFFIKLHWLPIKARIECKICLIVFKALRFGQPKYIADMLSPPITISDLTLHSDDDPCGSSLRLFIRSRSERRLLLNLTPRSFAMRSPFGSSVVLGTPSIRMKD